MAVDETAISYRPRGFSGYLADTRESRRIHHRIRYKVYCERKGFEDNALVRRRGLERDGFDGHALPFIIKDHALGVWRGTARLVLRGITPLPVESLGALPADVLADCPAGSVAEISRVAALPGHGGETAGDRWDLFRATIGTMLGYAATYRIRALLFLVTPSLVRVIDRLGLPFEACGTAIEHRGTRYPYVGDVRSAIARLQAQGCMPSFEPYSRLTAGDPASVEMESPSPLSARASA